MWVGDQTSLETQFDACASWWTSGLGHGNPQLSLEAAKAAGRYGHVIFPEAIHEPAMDLTNSLLDGVGKGWAERVFFSDNGSTAIEVALKMALRKRAVDLYGQVDDFPWQDMKVISFEVSRVKDKITRKIRGMSFDRDRCFVFAQIVTIKSEVKTVS